MVIQNILKKYLKKHRLEKVPKNQTVYCDEIKEEIFVLGQEIFIPKCIRDYFRGIEELDDKIRKFEFLSDCRQSSFL